MKREKERVHVAGATASRDVLLLLIVYTLTVFVGYFYAAAFCSRCTIPVGTDSSTSLRLLDCI